MKLVQPVIVFVAIYLSAFFHSAAAEPVTIKLSFEADLQNGQLVYELCAACHLPEGWGNSDGGYPQIAGQHQNVLIQQLLDIRSGKRENPIMYPFVQERTIGGYQSLVDVVMYISTLPMHPQHRKGPWNDFAEEYKQGQDLYNGLCAGCHGQHGEGNNETYTPKLYGQHFPYIQRQLRLIKNGQRGVNAAMKVIIDAQQAQNLRLIANYISYLAVPADEKAASPNWRNPDFYK